MPTSKRSQTTSQDKTNRARLVRTGPACKYTDPVEYPSHPYSSMKRYAGFLGLHYERARTRHAYYRDMRLLHEHFGQDPERLEESQVRDYFLHVKLGKAWKPKTVRQSAASARLFFEPMLGRDDWTVFSQIRARDDDGLPAVMTREQVAALLENIRLRRYRIPVKLIYYLCKGLPR